MLPVGGTFDIDLTDVVTDAGLHLPDSITEEQWRRMGVGLGRVVRASAWALGDWLNYGESRFVDSYADAVELTGLAYSTLATAAWMARKFPRERRRPSLPWSHHREVAGLDVDDQERLLDAAMPDPDDPALEPRLTSSDLRVQRQTIESSEQARGALDVYMRDYAATVGKLAHRARGEVNPRDTLAEIRQHTDAALSWVGEWLAPERGQA